MIYVYIQASKPSEVHLVKVDGEENAAALANRFPSFIYFFSEVKLEGAHE